MYLDDVWHFNYLDDVYGFKCLDPIITGIILRTRLLVWSYSMGGVTQMWILKKSKNLLAYIQSRSLSYCNSIKTLDFSNLYTTIPHYKRKEGLRELVQLCFIIKNGQRRYKCLVLGRDRSYCVKKQSDSTKKFPEADIINMLVFLHNGIDPIIKITKPIIIYWKNIIYIAEGEMKGSG
jgi:hypothetical protein